MKQTIIIAIVAMMALSKTYAQGHGPLYGLQTPTLARGGVSLNTAAMSIATNKGQSLMLRYLLSYGVTENLQLNITTPTQIKQPPEVPRTRGNSNMPANGNIEGSIWYRFFSNSFGVGKRFESTAILSVSTPTEKARSGTIVGNSIHGAISTGYASRTWYAWVGAGYQYYFKKDNEQLGDLPYGSLVVGYRPKIFKEDYPKPDWRIFAESLVEFPGVNRSNGQIAPIDQRGKKVMFGPSLLGLYGAWGISFGALFPLYQDVVQGPTERYRLSMNISYWL